MAGKTLSFPLLQNGDRLSRVEFERRYQAMPQLKKAELIEGVVHTPSPLRFRQHAQSQAHLLLWLGFYAQAVSGLEVGDNPTVRLDDSNEPQPDAVLMMVGGQAHFSANDYIEGSPELVAEIAASTVSHDLREKKQVYQRNGIQEYLVWRVLDNAIDWFCLNEESYQPLQPDHQNVIKSHCFPCLWLNVSALLSGDIPAVLATLQRGLKSRLAILGNRVIEDSFPL
ncbi:MAG: Uma2 family endonuclease [Synechococcaceae cyanobacterium SM2_3_2]|nr:Uma2 family endonuclease [Synechococcaceae cyanobacterium SM2_3_2]